MGSPTWLVFLTLAAAVLTNRQIAAQDEVAVVARPHLPQQVQWTTSRVVGFPDPPPPFQAQRVYPELSFTRLLNVHAWPGQPLMLALTHDNEWGGPGSILRFQDDPQAANFELFLRRDEIMYGVAFHPNFEQNGYLFVGCNGRSEQLDRVATRVLRFTVQSQPPFHCDPDSAVVIIEWPSDGHNGGDLAFGPDGLLYISAGDGTSDSDTLRNGQNLSTLAGSVIRIDVDNPPPGQTYRVPADNPFHGVVDARPEIWAYGLRNPWRLTFDHPTNQLWVGNNGQDLWETAHLVRRGENYGWSIREGNAPFHPGQNPGPAAIVAPTIEHHHSEARSLTGGVVYHGRQFPQLEGAYIYGDYSTGWIWAARYQADSESTGRIVWQRPLARTTLQITGFAVDHDGELLIADHGGGIYRLVEQPRSASEGFPRRLSETGLFDSVEYQLPAPGVIAYSVNSPLWSDGAVKQRWMAVPGDERVGFKERGAWNFPNGSVLVKTFAMAQDQGGEQRIETRILTRQDGQWYGYSYRWNEAQTDAELVPAEGQDLVLNVSDSQDSLRRQSWRIPSRSECMVCHTRAAEFVLGLNTPQMNRRQVYADDHGAAEYQQIEALHEIGFFTGGARQPGKPVAEYPLLVDPADEQADLDLRARSYLHVNCAVCHVEAGGGNAKIKLDYFTKLDDMQILDARPLHDPLGISDPRIVAPGDPGRSLLYQRLQRRGPGQMPPLGSFQPDPLGTALIRAWIGDTPPLQAK